MSTTAQVAGTVPAHAQVRLLPAVSKDSIIDHIFQKITYVRRRFNNRRTMELIEVMLNEIDMNTRDDENVVTFRRTAGTVNICIQIGTSVINLSSYEVQEGGEG